MSLSLSTRSSTQGVECGGSPASLRSPARCWPALAGASLLLATLPGCQGFTEAPAQAELRLIDASSGAGEIDVSLGAGVLAYNLAYGTVTSYVPVAPGTSTVRADVAGSRTMLATTPGTFAADGHYTVLVGNSTAGYRQTVLKDQTQPAPTGQAALRVLDQADRGGAVDLYLVPAGETLTGASPVLTDVTFGRNTGYLTVPAGTYSLVVLATGTTPAANAASSYTGAAQVYASGSARTVVLLNPSADRAQGLQAISANDYDPATP